MAKASTRAAKPQTHDPLDHDGDGRKGGSLPTAEREASVDGTLPDPVIAAPASTAKSAAPTATRVAAIPSKPVPAEVELPDVTPNLKPAGALIEVIASGAISRLRYANGAVTEHRVR